MKVLTLIEKLIALRPLNVEGFGPVVFQKDLLAVVRQHEAEQQSATLCLTRPRFPAADAHEAKSLATQMQVEQAFHFAMQKCLPNWGDGDFVDGGNLLALVSTAITALGGASETGIGNHASTAHLKDHALTPPASDGWIDWCGGECPVPSETVVEVVYRDSPEVIEGPILASEASELWSGENDGDDIIRYRIVSEGRES